MVFFDRGAEAHAIWHTAFSNRGCVDTGHANIINAIQTAVFPHPSAKVALRVGVDGAYVRLVKEMTEPEAIVIWRNFPGRAAALRA